MSDLDVRPMDRADEPRVRALFALCHPEWPQPPEWFFFAYPTLAVRVGDKIAGYASYSMSTTACGAQYMLGQDIGVDPRYRELGLGRALASARLNIARSLRAECFIGVTAPHNAAMLALMRWMEARFIDRIPEHYKHDTPPSDGLVFVVTF